MTADEKLKEIQSEMYPAISEWIDVSSCVFRLWYGDKYVIVKGKSLSMAVLMIQRGLAYFFYGGGSTGKGTRAGVKGAGYKEGDGKGSFYFQFNSFVKANPGLKWRIEVLIISDNGYKLLKREQQELEAAIDDKGCLSSNVEAYIPKFRKETNLYGGWIKPTHVLNFKKYLKKPIRYC